jgi:lipooligosaccharide transport system permease protein
MASRLPELPLVRVPPLKLALAVWWRHLLVWRRLIWPSMASNVANPLLLLFAFGFGLGAVIDTLAGVSYLAFVVPGMMAYTAMFAASFESTVSAYARFHMQRTWDAMLATPMSLTELLVGELLWAVTKAMVATLCVLVIAWAWGGVPSLLGALIALPLLALAAACFAAVGLAATAFARSWEFFSYFFTFWITPMFMFSGVFFEIERLPAVVQLLAWFLPMTHLIAILRPLTTGTPLGAIVLLHLVFIVLIGIAAFGLARRRFAERLFD